MRFLRILAFPVSLIYGLAVWFRNTCYDLGIFTSQRFQTPVIVIGNLSVGGTGKTPMTEFLIRILDSKKLAVLSRGYRRRSKGFLMATPGHGPEDLGDEPLQIYRKFPDLSLAVDADRCRGISRLEQLVEPEIILLDDAFQHRRVTPHLAILLTTYAKPYSRDWFLPTGNLRDSRSQAKRADLLIVTKCPTGISEAQRASIRTELQALPGQDVVFSSLQYALIDATGRVLENFDALGSASFSLLTGIAGPEPLLEFLRSMQFEFQHLRYPDHHHFTAREIDEFKRHAILVTTEKDAARLSGKLTPDYTISVRHVFDQRDRLVIQKHLDKLGG